ncbi:MAG: carbon starvation CstA family protein, partial [Verrucomicrobiota bacterium]
MQKAPVIRTLSWPALAGWSLAGLAVIFSLAVLALSRGEQVSALWIVVASACVFALAWRFHSAWLMAKVLTLNDARATPSVHSEDGKDYVPTNRWVVFGHHFAAIAGPGPLVGPVLAAQFGFLPGMLWILVGATLGGAVHDSLILFCSVRRGGKSLARMVRDEVGPFAGFVALVSTLAILVIILAVLALVVVKALAESSWGLFTIAATVPLAMAMGLGMKHKWAGMKAISTFGVAGLLLAVLGGKWIQG